MNGPLSNDIAIANIAVQNDDRSPLEIIDEIVDP